MTADLIAELRRAIWEDVAFHRALRADEARGIARITAWQVPADTEPIQLSEYDLDLERWLPGPASVAVTDSGPLGGPALSMPMNGLLAETPSPYCPWRASHFALRLACMHDHPGHTERPAFGGALCWRVVYLLVAAEQKPAQAADELGIPVADVFRRWTSASRWLLNDMDAKAAIRNSRIPPQADEPTPTRLTLLACDAVRRAVDDFDLEQRIWESQVGLLRRSLSIADDGVLVLEPEPAPHYVYIPIAEWERRHSWDVEWSRRQSELLIHQASCDRCRRAA